MTLVYVDDVAAGHLAAFERGTPGERYILADGYATMREILSVAVDGSRPRLGAAHPARRARRGGWRRPARPSRA